MQVKTLLKLSIAAAVATIAMGVVGRYPFALAAGLGINAFVAFSLVGADRLSWPDAMGVIVAEGLIISVLEGGDPVAEAARGAAAAGTTPTAPAR